jgi:hypothetical protein
MSNYTCGISRVGGGPLKPHWLRAGVIALVACAGACGQSVESKQQAASSNHAAASSGNTPSSSANSVSTSASSPVPAPHWWNPNWGQRTLSIPDAGGYNSYQSAARSDNRWHTLSTAPFDFYMLANSPDIGPDFQPPWAWAALFRNCASGSALVDDLTTEFGNRQRGAATIASVRQEFLTWAATQPQTLTLYLRVRLGQWNSGSGNFEIAPGSTGDVFVTRMAALASATGNAGNFQGLAAETDGTTSNAFRLRYVKQYAAEQAICPSSDGGLVWTDSMVVWQLNFGPDPAQSFDRGVPLPAVQMTSNQAQAFVARDPERIVIYEITVATTQQISIGSDVRGRLINKNGRILSARATDPSGLVLADSTH